uniref:Uncharacterized protein n=1 Tax=Geoglobus ahangari TaxID=113653 RepID=A0A7C4W3C8_9EURY
MKHVVTINMGSRGKHAGADPPGFEPGIYGYKGWCRLTEGAVLMAVEARKELLGAPKVEDYLSEEEDFTLAAYRLPCGLDGDTTFYSELVFVYTDFLEQERFDRIAEQMGEQSFFRYVNYYENMFSRSVYVIARRYKGFIRARKVGRNTFVAPAVGRARYITPLVYFADFIRERIDGFMHRFFSHWRKRRDHRIHRIFKETVKLCYVPDGLSAFDIFSSRFLLYILYNRVKNQRFKRRKCNLRKRVQDCKISSGYSQDLS